MRRRAGDEDLGVAIADGELDVGIGFVVAEKDVKAGLALLDEIVFKRERFAFVVDDDVVEVDGLAHEGAGFAVVGLIGNQEIGADAGAQVFGFADVDDFAFGIFVEVAAGCGGDGADFFEEVHACAATSLDAGTKLRILGGGIRKDAGFRGWTPRIGADLFVGARNFLEMGEDFVAGDVAGGNRSRVCGWCFAQAVFGMGIAVARW